MVERNSAHRKGSGQISEVDVSCVPNEGLMNIVTTSKSKTARGTAGSEDDAGGPREADEETGLEEGPC